MSDDARNSSCPSCGASSQAGRAKESAICLIDAELRHGFTLQRFAIVNDMNG